MSIIKKDEWKPVDGIVLEDNALSATKSSQSMLIVAGPGAGKSELLAQRACYLLQTNECIEPHKILAVSFKKDAASNIKDRVAKRCGQELSKRFKSMTFDAFSKSLVDQFINAIPSKYRPSKNYKIVDDRECIEILKRHKIYNLSDSRQEKEAYSKLINNLTIPKLPYTDEQKILEDTWQLLNLGDENESTLTFKMIGRLAEYLIRNNIMIKKALNMTYSHIFLDEYQDTTLIQYDLFKTCFYKTNVIVTAVGDDKQRIMGWAGALDDAFERLINDFDTEKTMLMMNHRSTPRLLDIQKTIYKEYFYKGMEEDIDIVKNKKWEDNEGECFLHLFKDDDQEAENISNEIIDLLASGYERRDICILVKQQIDRYSKKIINSLNKSGIKARDEGIYQELLKEDVIKLLFTFMKIIACKNSPDEWIYILNEVRDLDNSNRDDIYEYVEKQNNINIKMNEFKENLIGIKEEEQFKVFIRNLIKFLGEDKIKSKYSQYKNENTLKYYIDKFNNLLWEEYESCNNWEVALENFRGKDSIPIITIHKSKGLEYECVFFIGLEDSAFWSFSKQKHEDFCTFFVAISRAKKRLDFTFSKNRSTTMNQRQTNGNIGEFYSVLEKSGIVEIKEWYEN